MFTPWICKNGHSIEIDFVDSNGNCIKCNTPVTCKTTVSEVREAIELDKFRPVKTILIRGRKHVVEERECLSCHKLYETAYVNSRYCSKDCKNAESRKRERNRRMGLIICAFCGKKVESIDKRRKFCTADCRESMRKT